MNKTSDETKKGLECCSGVGHCFGECPYYNGKTNIECIRRKSADALAYIQQLEAANAELLTKVEQLERERDAIFTDCKTAVIVCDICKHRAVSVDEIPCVNCSTLCKSGSSNFVWRGVKEE